MEVDEPTSDVDVVKRAENCLSEYIDNNTTRIAELIYQNNKIYKRGKGEKWKESEITSDNEIMSSIILKDSSFQGIKDLPYIDFKYNPDDRKDGKINKLLIRAEIVIDNNTTSDSSILSSTKEKAENFLKELNKEGITT